MKNIRKSIIISVLFLCGISLCIGASLCINFASAGYSSMLSVSPVLAGGVNGFFANAWTFIKTNWLWFSIGGGVLLLLIIIIIIVAVSKRKKKKRRAKEELLARTLEMQPEDAAQTDGENHEQEVEVENEIDHKFDVANLGQASYSSGLPGSGKTLPEIMDYIKMRMKLDQNKHQVSSQSQMARESGPVVDERVRLIQKEYQEELRRIDEIMQQQEREKLYDEMNREQELINKMEEEYAIADNLLHELNVPQIQPQVQTQPGPEPIEQPKEEEKVNQTPNIDYRILTGEKPKDYSDFANIQINIIANEPLVEKEEDKTEKEVEPEEEADDTKIVASDAIIISANKKSFREAFESLPAKQKQYFNKLRDYADKKPDSRAKEGKNFVVVGCGNKHYIKLTIKRNTVVACFLLESEEMQRLRLLEKLPVKPEETQIKVTDDKTFAIAKQMIDLRINQIERENQIVKELRKEKRKQAKK